MGRCVVTAAPPPPGVAQLGWQRHGQPSPHRLAWLGCRGSGGGHAGRGRTGQTIRMTGSGHSFTPTAVTDGVLLRPDRMTAIRSVDLAAGTVTVEAGCPLHVLNAELLARGLSLANMGDIQVQTVAGATQTGTHGTGRDVGGMAAQVAGLELVLADGRIVTCSADSPERRPHRPGRRSGRPARRRASRARRARHRDRADLPRRSRLPARGPRRADELVPGRSATSTSSRPTTSTSSSTGSRTARAA